MNYLIEEYARLCEDVYFPVVEFDRPNIIKKNTNENDKDFKGYYKNSPLKYMHQWSRAYDSDPLSNGFYASYYIKNNNEDQGVIVYRGSDDFYDFADHDLKIAMGEWPYAFKDAEKFYHQVIGRYNPEFLAIAGHSLGGGLAQLIGIKVNKFKLKQDRHPVICFNAPQMGFLIHDNPDKDLLSKIDNKNKDFFNNQKSISKEYISCVSNFKQPNLKSNIIKSTFDVVSEFGKIIICNKKDDYNYKKLLNGKEFADKSIEDISKIYKNICKYKNISNTVNFGQPAFNAIYDLLNIKDKENILSNDSSFESDCNKYEKEYDYIFNFNSYFDLVHVCGKPLGNSLSIDIDRPEYLKYWGDTGESYNFTDYNQYKKSKAYQSRLKSELRVCLTLHPEYFKHKNIWHEEKSSSFNIANLLKLKIEHGCKINLRNTSLDKLNLSLVDALSILAEEHFDLTKYNRFKSFELLYMAKLQHVMKNLGNILQKEPLLNRISIGRNYKDVPIYLKRYTSKYNNNFDSSLDRVNYLIQELGLDVHKSCGVSSVGFV